MDSKTLNERLQLFASIGVIIGLIMVAVEIRQSSKIARDDTFVAIVDSWSALTISELESDISEVFAKSVESPESLTNAELFRLGAWLQTFVQIWQLQVQMDQGAELDVNSEIRNEAYYLFGNHASRAWYEENKYWMSPVIIAIVDDHIAANPVGTDKAYFDAIRARILAATAKAE